jgi:hypothetical protein
VLLGAGSSSTGAHCFPRIQTFLVFSRPLFGEISLAVIDGLIFEDPLGKFVHFVLIVVFIVRIFFKRSVEVDRIAVVKHLQIITAQPKHLIKSIYLTSLSVLYLQLRLTPAIVIIVNGTEGSRSVRHSHQPSGEEQDLAGRSQCSGGQRP